MSVGATQWEGEDRTGGHGQQQTHSHILLAQLRAQVATVSITGVLVWGITWVYCTGVCVGEMSKVDVIERVNTIWEQRHWTRANAVHLL